MLQHGRYGIAPVAMVMQFGRPKQRWSNTLDGDTTRTKSMTEKNGNLDPGTADPAGDKGLKGKKLIWIRNETNLSRGKLIFPAKSLYEVSS